MGNTTSVVSGIIQNINMEQNKTHVDQGAQSGQMRDDKPVQIMNETGRVERLIDFFEKANDSRPSSPTSSIGSKNTQYLHENKIIAGKSTKYDFKNAASLQPGKSNSAKTDDMPNCNKIRRDSDRASTRSNPPNFIPPEPSIMIPSPEFSDRSINAAEGDSIYAEVNDNKVKFNQTTLTGKKSDDPEETQVKVRITDFVNSDLNNELDNFYAKIRKIDKTGFESVSLSSASDDFYGTMGKIDETGFESVSLSSASDDFYAEMGKIDETSFESVSLSSASDDFDAEMEKIDETSFESVSVSSESDDFDAEMEKIFDEAMRKINGDTQERIRVPKGTWFKTMFGIHFKELAQKVYQGFLSFISFGRLGSK